jgi:hypothetical protein
MQLYFFMFTVCFHMTFTSTFTVEILQQNSTVHTLKSPKGGNESEL